MIQDKVGSLASCILNRAGPRNPTDQITSASKNELLIVALKVRRRFVVNSDQWSIWSSILSHTVTNNRAQRMRSGIAYMIPRSTAFEHGGSPRSPWLVTTDQLY